MKLVVLPDSVTVNLNIKKIHTCVHYINFLTVCFLCRGYICPDKQYGGGGHKKQQEAAAASVSRTGL